MPPSSAYQVVLARRVAAQLREAPPELRGDVAGVVALLRTDPSVGTAAFRVIRDPESNTIVFPDGRGFLGYHVFEERRLVVLVDLAWP